MGDTIVVLGAGVSGLTTALLLSKDRSNTITVIAKHMPGDYDIEYASPFAGANVLPMATRESSRWERETWTELKRICKEIPEAGIHFQKAQIHRRNEKPGEGAPFKGVFEPKPWFSELFDDYRDLPNSAAFPGYDTASEYTSVCINTGTYLQWLVGQLLMAGVVFKRGVVSDIQEAKKLSHTGRTASIVVNATGMGSRKLGGVQDSTMYPARAQVVMVRNEVEPMIVAPPPADAPATDAMYAMTRAAGGGTILGGTFEIDNWESQPDPNTALRIMSRIVAARPDIANGKGVAGLSVIRHAVGLRPYRKEGVRIEEEKLDDETWVVHNYGHGGWGYQGSYGCASDVIKLVRKIKDSRGTAKAKL